jgi:predicted RNA-binding Zn-ribbon protein involved in translation (DUF1610 family)
MTDQSLISAEVRCPACGAEATLTLRSRSQPAAHNTVYLCPNMCAAPSHAGRLIKRSAH